MIIVETDREKEIFLQDWNSEKSIIIPIWEDLERHPMNNSLSFLYVHIGDKDYILSYNHNDCESIQIDLSESEQSKWIWDKKGFLQTQISIKNLKDIQTYLFFQNNTIYDLNTKLEGITSFYYRLGMKDGLGKSLPIMKWGEILGNIVSEWKLENDSNRWIDDTMIPILSEIEKSGLHVDREKFFDRWPSNGKHLKGDVIYTEYNPYTITSRPSNRHGGINFSALNKKDGSREVFVPKPGHIFLQFDYDAYHVRLIGKMIRFPLPNTSVHQWLADQYGMEYGESKGRTFRILYGGVSDEDKKIPFFQKVDEFIQKIDSHTTEKGWVSTLNRKIPISHIENPNPQKVFNYLLQATETEFNIEVMNRLKINGLPLPILYTYDSFLFEYPIDGDTETAKGIKSVLESFGFPIKASWGMDYSKV